MDWFQLDPYQRYSSQFKEQKKPYVTPGKKILWNE